MCIVQDKQSRFVVRSCLGGLDDRFVLKGSEECRVYVYHRFTGEGACAPHASTMRHVRVRSSQQLAGAPSCPAR